MKYFTNKNILIISPEAWGISKLSKHHYAESLVRQGNRVWFLEPPGFSSVPTDHITSVHLLKDKHHFRGLRFLPALVRSFLLKQSANSIIREAGVDFDVVWSFDNSRHFNLEYFSARTRIHHVVDIGMDYNLSEAATSSTLCLSTLESGVRKLKCFNEHSYFLNHGYAPQDEVPVQLPGRPGHIKCCYLGNLLIPYIDWELLENLVKENSEIDFVLVGPTGKGNMNKQVRSEYSSQIENIRQIPNVFLSGEKSTAESQSILSKSDILLLFYNQHRYPVEVENPHKMMMYLGAGKVILAHHMPAYNVPPLVETATDRNNYLERFTEICSNLTWYNNAEHMKIRQSFAANHTYERQLSRIEELILQSIHS